MASSRRRISKLLWPQVIRAVERMGGTSNQANHSSQTVANPDTSHDNHAKELRKIRRAAASVINRATTQAYLLGLRHGEMFGRMHQRQLDKTNNVNATPLLPIREGVGPWKRTRL